MDAFYYSVLYVSVYQKAGRIQHSKLQCLSVCSAHLILLDFTVQSIPGNQCKPWTVSLCDILKFLYTSAFSGLNRPFCQAVTMLCLSKASDHLRHNWSSACCKTGGLTAILYRNIRKRSYSLCISWPHRGLHFSLSVFYAETLLYE